MLTSLDRFANLLEGLSDIFEIVEIGINLSRESDPRESTMTARGSQLKD